MDDNPLKPTSLSINDSILIVKNSQSENLFSLYDLVSGYKICDFINFGPGPEEMINPKIVEFNDSLLWISDNQLRKLYSYDVSLISNGIINKSKEVNQLEYFSDVGIINNNNFVALVTSPFHHRMTFYNIKGDSIKSVGEFPAINGRNLTFIEKIEGYKSNITINKFEKKILISYKNTDLIEIYDFVGNLLNRNHGPNGLISEMKEFDEGDGSMQNRFIEGKSYDAYFSPQTVKNSFFILYSGKPYSNEPNYLMDEIFVFDVNGNPSKRFKLDIPIFAMATDGNTQTIYGITDKPEFRIIKYQY